MFTTLKTLWIILNSWYNNIFAYTSYKSNEKNIFLFLYLSGMYAGNSQQLFLTFRLSTKLHVNVTVGNVTVGYLTITLRFKDLFQINLDVCDSNS